MSDVTMWAVHVAGPDDLFAMPDRATADAMCADLNGEFAREPSKQGLQASVVKWPYGYEFWKTESEQYPRVKESGDGV